MSAQQICRECGCSDGRACVTMEGPCHWVEANLCSACALLEVRALALSFEALRELNGRRTREFFHSIEAWSPTDWACAVAGETGELCNLIKKLRRGEDVSPDAVKKEMADAVIYLDLLAQRLGFKLGDCVQQKFNEVSERVSAPYRL